MTYIWERYGTVLATYQWPIVYRIVYIRLIISLTKCKPVERVKPNDD